MKALSVRQPYATLIATGEKTIEWRSWKTPHRGALMICSSSSWAEGEEGEWEMWEIFKKDRDQFPRGVTLCIVDLVDCRPFKRKDLDAALMEENPGGYAWVLANPVPIVPRPIKGKHYLFDVPAPPEAGDCEADEFC